MNLGDKAPITSSKVCDLSEIPILISDGLSSSDLGNVTTEDNTLLDGGYLEQQNYKPNGLGLEQDENLLLSQCNDKNLKLSNLNDEIDVDNGTSECPVTSTECCKDLCAEQLNKTTGSTTNVSDNTPLSSLNLVNNPVCNGNCVNPISEDTLINDTELSGKRLLDGDLSSEVKVNLTLQDKPISDLAFVEKKPSIPGFGDDDDHDISTAEDGTDFWQMVSGKTEEELAKEAEEEREWLRCIEEEEKKHTEEERKKKILEEVAKNLELIEEPSSESEEEEKFIPPLVTDPKLIFDPAKVPEGGVIEDEYKQAMGFMEVTEEPQKKKKAETVESETNDKAGETVLQNDEALESQEMTDEKGNAEAVPSEIKAPRSIEELEVELVEEAKKAARNGPSNDQMEISSEKSDEAVIIIHDQPPITHDPPSEPIILQESKVGTSSVVYKLGVKKKVPGAGRLLGGGKKSGSEAVVKTPQEKEVDELERLAMQELLSEAKRGAELAKEIGPLGWQKSRVPPTNKRFLVNTLRETLREPRSRRGRRSKSRSRSRSRDRRRSRSRERRRSKSREKRRSRSRSSERGSRSRRRTSRSRSRDGSRSDPKRSKRKRRSRSRSRSRSNDGKRRTRRSDSHNSEKSDSKKASSKHDSKKTNKNDPKVASLQKALVKPSKCGWSSDEDDFLEPTDQQSESTENDESKTAHARAKSVSEASEVSTCEFPVKSYPVITVSGTPSEVSEPGSVSVVSENPLVVEVSVDKTMRKSNNLEQQLKLDNSSEKGLKRKSTSKDDIDCASPKKPKNPDSSESQIDDIAAEITGYASEQILVKTDITPEPVLEKTDLAAAGPSGSKVDLVTNLEIKATLSTLDAIVETPNNLKNGRRERIQKEKTEASKTVTEVSQELELDSYSESENEVEKPSVDSRTRSDGTKPKSEGAMKEPLDDRTRRKLDIVESALKEIEDNPVDLDESVPDQKHRSSKKKKKHKEHKKHKHKHKKRKRSDD